MKILALVKRRLILSLGEFIFMNLFRKAQFTALKYAEPRALLEWQSFFVFRSLLKKLPKGDGHSVLVFPGFGSNDLSTLPLRNLLDDLGYETYGWGLGANVLFDKTVEIEMVDTVKEVAVDSGRSVSLIGFDLGGLFVREVAKECPDIVRSVISLASPISGQLHTHTNSSFLLNLLNGEPSSIQQDKSRRLYLPPSMPTTSIYSKTDGFVAWESSVQKSYPNTENIEIPASHIGMVANPLAAITIADRLAQPEGEWQAFEPKGWQKMVFHSPCPSLTKR